MTNQKRNMQLIDENGALDETDLKNFVRTQLDGGASYPVLSILGPQSSGKSTLLNLLYKTNFWTMDAARGWRRTTKGVFMAKSNGILIMDVEGNDSGEREGHQSYEKKLAAFSFAISGIVLVNMKNDSIGRHSGGCTDLLETSLEFMICFLGHHKLTMMIVVRDWDPVTPIAKIEELVKQRIEKIWKGIKKPECLQDKRLKDCFDVQVAVMSNYRHEEDEFLKEVSILRTRIEEIASGQGTQRYFAREFAPKVVEQWNFIRRSKELDIPTYKESIAYKRCDEIAKEHIHKFEKELNDMEKVLKSEPTKIFPFEVDKSIRCSLEQYDKGTIYFNQSVTSQKRSDLQCELLKCAQRAFQVGITHLHPEIIKSFKDLLQASFKSSDDSTAKNIIEDSIIQIVDKYHELCKGMIVGNAQWNINVADKSLRRELESEAKKIKEIRRSRRTLLRST